MPKMERLPYYCNCVSWPKQDVDAEGGLCDMIDRSIEITRRTFLKHVDRVQLLDLELSLSYTKHWTQGLTMASDWSVSYHRSKLHGKTVYYFRQSAIEYVFAEVQ